VRRAVAGLKRGDEQRRCEVQRGHGRDRGDRDRTERQGGSARVVETRDERLERGLEEQDVGEREAEVGATAPRGDGVRAARREHPEQDCLASERRGQHRPVKCQGGEVRRSGHCDRVERDAPPAPHVAGEAARDERGAGRGRDRGVTRELDVPTGRERARRREDERLRGAQQQVPAEADGQQCLVVLGSCRITVCQQAPGEDREAGGRDRPRERADGPVEDRSRA